MSQNIFQELRCLLLERVDAEVLLEENLGAILRENEQVYFDSIKLRAPKITEEVFSLFVKRVSPEIQQEAISLLFQYFDSDADGAVSRKELSAGLHLDSEFSFTENSRLSNSPANVRRSNHADAENQLGLAFMAILSHVAGVERERARLYNLPGFNLGRLFSELSAGRSQVLPEDLRRFLGEAALAERAKDAPLRLFEILQQGGSPVGMRAFRRLVTPQFLSLDLLLANLPLDPAAAHEARFETPGNHKTVPVDFEGGKKEALQLFDSYRLDARPEEEDYQLVEPGRPVRASGRDQADSPYINLQDKFIHSEDDKYDSPPREHPHAISEPPRLLKKKYLADSGCQAEAEAEDSLQESYALLGPELGKDRVQEFADYPHSAKLVSSDDFQTPQLKAPAVAYSFFGAPQKDPSGRESLKPSEQSAKAVSKRLEFRSSGSQATAQAADRHPPANYRSSDLYSPDRQHFRIQPERIAPQSSSKPYESSGSLRVRFAVGTPNAATHAKKSTFQRSQPATSKHHYTHSTGVKEPSDWKASVRRDKTSSPSLFQHRPLRTSQTYKEVQRQILFEELF